MRGMSPPKLLPSVLFNPIVFLRQCIIISFFWSIPDTHNIEGYSPLADINIFCYAFLLSSCSNFYKLLCLFLVGKSFQIWYSLYYYFPGLQILYFALFYFWIVTLSSLLAVHSAGAKRPCLSQTLHRAQTGCLAQTEFMLPLLNFSRLAEENPGALAPKEVKRQTISLWHIP